MPPVEIGEDSMSKHFDDFVAECILENKSIVQDVGSYNDNIDLEINKTDEFCQLKDTVSKLDETVSKLYISNSAMKKQIRDLQEENDDIWDEFYKLERDLIQFMQYNRRENVEIVGLPESIPDNRLEETVVDILGRIGVSLSHYDIVGCHRLKNRKSGFSNVIVRFLNRKHVKEVFACKRKLQEYVPEYRYINIVENLCPKNKSIFDQCVELKKANIIRHLWTFNSTIYIKKTDYDNEKPKKILHKNDIDYYFPNYEVK